MAKTTTCDRCGKGPALPVQASLAMWGVADPEFPTAHTVGADLCEDCQEDGIAVLFEHCRETLREQAPVHAKMVALGAARDEAQHEWDDFSRVFLAEHEKAVGLLARKIAAGEVNREAAPDPVAFVPEEIVQRRDALLSRIAEHEAARSEEAGRGTSLSDARYEKLTKALKKRKK